MTIEFRGKKNKTLYVNDLYKITDHYRIMVSEPSDVDKFTIYFGTELFLASGESKFILEYLTVDYNVTICEENL